MDCKPNVSSNIVFIFTINSFLEQNIQQFLGIKFVTLICRLRLFFSNFVSYCSVSVLIYVAQVTNTVKVLKFFYLQSYLTFMFHSCSSFFTVNISNITLTNEWIYPINSRNSWQYSSCMHHHIDLCRHTLN